MENLGIQDDTKDAVFHTHDFIVPHLKNTKIGCIHRFLRIKATHKT